MLITRRQDPVHDARAFRPQLELENFLREKIHMLGRIVLAHTNQGQNARAYGRHRLSLHCR